MKILYVIDALGVGGGAEHSLAVMLPRLRDRGVDCSVACLIPREGGLQRRLREEGFEVIVLGARSLPTRVLELRSLVRAQKPDLVHATLFNSCLATRLASPGLGVSEIDSLVNTPYDPVRQRDLGVPHWKLRVVQGVDRITARLFVDRFHAVSGAVAKAATETLGLDPDRITVVPRGRSFAELTGAGVKSRRAGREDLGLDLARPVLLNVGRQDHQKAQELLIRAMPHVLRRHPDTILLVAGREGSATPGIRDALLELGLGEAIRFLGHREDVPDLLALADVFVFPSLYEGTGGAVIEAMATGLPVVASDIEAMREVVGPDAGLLVPLTDDHALAAAIDRLLSEPSLRSEMGMRGRRRFLERYTLDAVVDTMLDFYREVSSPRV